MNKYLDCWQSDEHTVLFDSLSYIPTFYLKKTYSKYHEIKLLKRFLPQDDSISLLEVGCATGEIYRYFKNVF